MAKNNSPATIYKDTGFGCKRIEAQNVVFDVAEFDAYESAVLVEYTIRGKRKREHIIETYKPSVVIVEGWAHPEMITMLTEPLESGGSIGRSLYPSFDQRWDAAFDEFITQYISQSGATGLADFRQHNTKKKDIPVSDWDDSDPFADDVAPAPILVASEAGPAAPDNQAKSSSQDFTLLPDEITTEPVQSDGALLEGKVKQILVNRYERDTRARQECIEHYGTSCFICGFDFAEVYGDAGSGFIHVHHLIPLSEIGQEYKVNPVEHLRPLCPNCHAIVHIKASPYSIDDVKAMIHRSQK